MELKLAGLVGHFAEHAELNNGQVNKTRIVCAELKRHVGNAEVCATDSYHWQRKPFRLLKNCFKLVRACRNIVIFPAHNGIRVFVPMFCVLNRFYKRKLHYVVIGGWLPEFLERHKLIRRFLHRFHCIYVETNGMKSKLENMGYSNVYVMPNFKHLNVLKPNELVYHTTEPFAFCTFSRVMKEKGIEDAARAVTNINEESGRVCCTLDIYGQVDSSYAAEFQNLEAHFPAYIRYRGIVPADKSVETIKHYFALLFPTQYEGEGFAGTLIDSFSSGTPVITTNWHYNSEIVENYITGIIYADTQAENLEDAMKWAMENKNAFLSMKEKCLSAAEKLKPDNAVSVLLNNLS